MTIALFAALIAQVLTPEEAKASEAVVSALVAAGFPDGAKATVRAGKLSLTVTFDPSKEPSPLPTSASTMQMSVPKSTKMRYGFAFGGVHVKLADGTWLVGGEYAFNPKEGDVVDESEAPVVDVATLTETAVKARAFDAEKDAAKWLEGLAPAHRARAAKAMNILVPVTHHLTLGADALVVAIPLLHRAGWKDALVAGVALADQRSRNYWQLRPWTEPDFAFDPTGAYPKAKEIEQAWKKANPQAVPEAPDVALRRALYRVCLLEIMAEYPLLTPDVAAAACKAMLDPKDPQKHGARVEALRAAARLPVTLDEKADLATRLASWEARPREPRMVVTTGDDGLSMSTAFVSIPPAYEPKKADLDALVALLADERPSRCVDFSGSRTVGDNAWRALATLLNADPRALAKHPVDKPWTAAERRAAATAFQRWWKENRAKHVEK